MKIQSLLRFFDLIYKIPKCFSMTACGCETLSENSEVPKTSLASINSSKPNRTSRDALLDGKNGSRPTLLTELISIK